jgi:hypothetical protein
MADHSKPLTTSTYANFVTELDGRFDDITLGLDPANTSPTNLPTNAIRWSSAALKWQKWDGTTFNDLAASYTININGTVGATTPAAGTFTTLSSTGNTTLGNASGDTVTITGTIQPGVVVSGSSTTDMFRITQTGTGNAFVVEDAANPDASPFVIDTDGNVGIGTTTPDGNFEVSGTATAQYLTRYSTDTSSTVFVIRKSRGTEAAPTVVVNGDNLGAITFQGYDGSGFSSAAQILVESNGTPGTTDMPGSLKLRTTSDGSGTLSTRMTILSTGFVGIANVAPVCILDVTGGIQTSRTTVTSPAATDGNIFSGTYTPTLTNTTNVAASTPVECFYTRVGNVVTVTGQVSIDVTTTLTDSVLLMTLPIASTFTVARNCGGTGASSTSGTYGTETIAIMGNVASGSAEFRLRPASVANLDYRFSFSYRVL